MNQSVASAGWLLLVLALVGALVGCSHQAEPRWLVRALPGDYPNVVYFVPTDEKAIALTIDDGNSVAGESISLKSLGVDRADGAS